MTNRFGDALVATGLTAVCLVAGCASHQPVHRVPGSSADGAMLVLGSQPVRPTSVGAVRVESIRRIDREGLTGMVTVRNITASPATVWVGVIWLDASGDPVQDFEVPSREIVTLAPLEQRDLEFKASSSSRDFRVAMHAQPH
ncbi:MAG: hypothetical protein FGM37_00095 [Phycisphaerales bacterium]|nr:hypothetical protein [Phycisphaerales bacterium]